MNLENVDYLKNQIKYTGFGEDLSNALEGKIKQELETFTLEFQSKFDHNTMDVELYFSKALTHDMYFFNAYKVRLVNSGGELIQTFYINKGNSITLKEAYNLLNWRAVHKKFRNKNGNQYNCWVQLDPFAHTANGNYKLLYYHENYGFDLRATIAKYPILEMELEDFKESIINSLEKGNLQMVTFEINGMEEVRLIEANPKFKSISIYNENMEKQFWQPIHSKIKNVAEKMSIAQEKAQTESQKKEKQPQTEESITPSSEDKTKESLVKRTPKRKKRPRITQTKTS